jgi:hypothetical protein
MKLRFSFFLPFGFLLFAVFVIKAPAEEYDPLALSENGEVTIKDMSVENPARSREIPIRLYLPETIDKYELVLQDAEHSAFSDRSLRGDQIERNPNHHRAVLALSTAFWDTYLRENAEAKEWLQGDGPRSVLDKEDRWQMEKAR